jgi:hypothetical protein
VASDKEEERRTFVLTSKLQATCHAELGAAGDDDEAYRNALTNVVTALQVTVARLLILTGIPPADFMALVESSMKRMSDEPKQPRGVA